MATVEAVVNHNVEVLDVRVEDPAGSAGTRTEALDSILRTLTARAPAEIRTNPSALREAAGSRPHRRLHVIAKARVGGIATVELQAMPGGIDDVKPNEGIALDQRVMHLLAARLLEELAAP